MSASSLPRRDFLRLAAGGATLLAAAAGCDAGSGPEGSEAGAASQSAGNRGRPTLRIAQWTHYVAGYDRWWDGEYTQQWGEQNGFDVLVDHFDINQAAIHAEAEAASQRGHDLFHLNLTVAAPFEDQAIDHREIVEEVEAKVGRMPAFAARSLLNPKTKKYFGFSPHWIPNPTHYRTDLWAPTGRRPDTWDEVLAAGRRLKAGGHPIGIGLGPDPESNVTLLGLMHAFGSSVQDEDSNVVVNSPATVEAVKMGTALFREAMTDEVLNWDITSNNRYLLSGRGSLIVNSVAALRALEAQDSALAADVTLLPPPAGPAGAANPYVVSVYVIWKFSENQEAAKRFLIDLATAPREAFLRSRYLQIPTFPEAVPDLAALLADDPQAQPAGKYGLLAEAAKWTTNIGHPGFSNAAIEEVLQASVISDMFGAAARGEMSAADAVAAAEARITPIYEKWRERGKI